MTVKIEMKCDYSGYCYMGTITPDTEEQVGWFEFTAVPDRLTVRRLTANDKVVLSAKHACKNHGPDLAGDLASYLTIFAVPDVPAPAPIHAVAKDNEPL